MRLSLPFLMILATCTAARLTPRLSLTGNGVVERLDCGNDHRCGDSERICYCGQRYIDDASLQCDTLHISPPINNIADCSAIANAYRNGDVVWLVSGQEYTYSWASCIATFINTGGACEGFCGSLFADLIDHLSNFCGGESGTLQYSADSTWTASIGST